MNSKSVSYIHVTLYNKVVTCTLFIMCDLDLEQKRNLYILTNGFFSFLIKSHSS